MLAAMPRQLAGPGHCRAWHGPGGRVIHAIAFVSFWCAIGSPGAFSDLNDCDFPVTSDAGGPHDQTQDEVEEELVRQLAIKLRQFDRCIDRELSSVSNPAEDSASHAVDGGQTGVVNSGNGGQNPGEGIEQNSPGTGTLEQVGDPIAGAGNEGEPEGAGEGADQPAPHASSDAVASAAGAAQAAGSALPSGNRTVRDNVVEDDVARILREAAEKETDPTRRAALWNEYQNYVKNL